MARVRSPNYPNASLGTALAYAKTVFDSDHRNKLARETVAKHLGHEGLTGPALGKLGAMRAYGLLEGTQDELRVSEDAVTALMAPEGSEERRVAIERLSQRPSLFHDIMTEYPAKLPSDETLIYWLVKRGFTPDAATIASRSFRDTMQLVADVGGSYGISELFEQPSAKPETAQASRPTASGTGSLAPRDNRQVSLMTGERELTTGLLSKDANFRLIVSGPVGVKEIERLIAKLELDKEILAEPDDASPDEEME